MDLEKLELRLKEISGGKVINVATGSGLFKYIFNTQKVTWEKPQ